MQRSEPTRPLFGFFWPLTIAKSNTRPTAGLVDEFYAGAAQTGWANLRQNRVISLAAIRAPEIGRHLRCELIYFGCFAR
jgi:hypothetical protein